MKKLFKQFFLFVIFFLWGLGGLAQTYPVTIYSRFTYPTPIYLSNYANRTTVNSPLIVQLMLNDLNIANNQIRLKFYLQGRMTLVSKDYVIGAQPIYLQGGFPTELTNIQLAPYFEFQNLLGINPNQYGQPIPEGSYDFCVEVYDFATNKRLSRRTCVSTVIFHNDPPILNLPANNEKVMKQDIQNIVFSWTPRNINVSNVEYEFSLVELWNPNIPYQTAFDYAPPLYTESTRMTTLQYDMMKPQLIPGKSYAWRVKAKALKGAEEIGMFKNNGFSEIFTFKYLTNCHAPTSVTTTAISQDQAKVTWIGDIANWDYQVSYREKNARSKWYTIVTPRQYATIRNLKPNTTYEYTVGAACDLGEYTLSRIEEFTTLAHDEIAFAGCGIKPDPADLLNKTPLPALLPNDVVTAGDFPIVVQHVSGGNGIFSGDGFVTLPFIDKFRKAIGGTFDANSDQNVGIKITFNNIGVNTDFKLISGEIVASYDPNWGSVTDIDPWIDAVKELTEEITKFLTNYKGTEEDKIKAVELEQKQNEVYEQIINDEDLPLESKIVLETSQKETENDWNDLKNGTPCEDEVEEKEIVEKKELETTEKPKTAKKFNCKIKKVEQQNKEITKQNEKLIEKKKSIPIVIFVNGYWNNGFLQKDLLGFSDGLFLDKYWGKDLKTEIKRYFNVDEKNLYYLNGADGMTSSGGTRFSNGLQFVKDRLKNKLSKFQREVFIKNRKILVVSHSMGGAFAEGLVKELTNNKMQVDKVVHLSPADNSDFNVTLPEKTFQIDISLDFVLALKNMNDKKHINGVKNYALAQNPDHDQFGHADTKLEPYVWHWFEDLELVKFEYKGIETETITTPGSGMGYGSTSLSTEYEKYNVKNLKYNTIFIDIMKNSKNYFYKDTKKIYYSTKK